MGRRRRLHRRRSRRIIRAFIRNPPSTRTRGSITEATKITYLPIAQVNLLPVAASLLA